MNENELMETTVEEKKGVLNTVKDGLIKIKDSKAGKIGTKVLGGALIFGAGVLAACKLVKGDDVDAVDIDEFDITDDVEVTEI